MVVCVLCDSPTHLATYQDHAIGSLVLRYAIAVQGCCRADLALVYKMLCDVHQDIVRPGLLKCASEH